MFFFCSLHLTQSIFKTAYGLGERTKDSLIDLSDEAVGISDGLPTKFAGLGWLDRFAVTISIFIA